MVSLQSIRFDMVCQCKTPQGMNETIAKVIQLHPDRTCFIAMLMFHGLSQDKGNSQKRIAIWEAKRVLYESGREQFEKAGYLEIRMDHFAVQDDKLVYAEREGKLHRNFMGYTTLHTQLLVEAWCIVYQRWMERICSE